MTIRDEQAHEAASMYYLQGHTMDTIARTLDISRSSVSRLLTYARETGLVRISLAASPSLKGTLAGQISELFDVQVSVVPTYEAASEVDRLHNVALAAADLLMGMLRPGAVLGIAWGNTTAEITRCMPSIYVPGSTVVQLNGAATATESGLPYADAIIARAARAIGATMVNFPVPAFFDYVETKRQLWREHSIQTVLKTIDRCTVALFGVGSMSSRLPSHVYAGGFLDPDEIAAVQKDGVVGDVCTVLIREDGSTDMALNKRASGPKPEVLRTIPRRLCVVSGASKALPLLGALRTGVATDLVLDDRAARELLELVHTRTTAPSAV